MLYSGNIHLNSIDNLPDFGCNVFSKCQSDIMKSLSPSQSTLKYKIFVIWFEFLWLPIELLKKWLQMS